MARTILRRARKAYRDCHPIQPGDLYIESTTYPGDDMGIATAAGHPLRWHQCRACAEFVGRGHLFPTPEEVDRG